MIGVEFSPPIKELQKQLSRLSGELQLKAVRVGLVAAIKPVKKSAKSKAPKETGALAQAIGHKSLSKTAKSRLGIPESTVALVVGPNRKVAGRYQGKKGLWHEHGTERMSANPFMGPALNENESKIEPGFYAGLSKYLNKAL